MWKKVWPIGGGNKKLQLYPTNLTYSTPTVPCKALGYMTGDGFVQCDGLFGGFWGSSRENFQAQLKYLTA